MSVKCGTCKGHHPTVADVRACDRLPPLPLFGNPARPGRRHTDFKSQPSVRLASPAQVAFLRSLLASRDVPVTALGRVDSIEALLGDADLGGTKPIAISAQRAHKEIDWLKGLRPRTADSLSRECKANDAVTRDGMYRDPESGEIFKVQFNKASGDGRRLYAKQLVGTTWTEADSDAEPDRITRVPLTEDALFDRKISWGFEYVRGAVHTLRDDMLMTKEEAKQFGALYGTCIRCGRTLTLEESIERALGRVCAKAFG